MKKRKSLRNNKNQEVFYVEEPHESTTLDAGTGQGTVKSLNIDEGSQRRPILDGSTEKAFVEEQTKNDYKGEGEPKAILSQPALATASSSRWLIAGVVSLVIITVAMLLQFQWNPVLTGLGAVTAMLLLLAMVLVRVFVVNKSRGRGLKAEGFLLLSMWIIAIGITIAVLASSRQDILGFIEGII